MPINSKHPAYSARVSQWKRCRDVYEGSDSVKDAGVEYLPRPGGQSNQEYEAYKTRATLYEALGRTVEGFCGSIARKPPKVDAPDAFEDILEDVTASGIGLLEFIKIITAEVLLTSRVGLVVDYDEALKRPFLQYYKAEQITNWFKDGSVVVEEVVYEHDSEDQFKNVSITQWLHLSMQGEDGARQVYTINTWRKRKERAGYGEAEFYIHETRIPTIRNVPFDFIPFYFCSRNGSASAIEKPPLLGLADVVISHYRTSADLEHGRHFTALPTLYISGMTATEDVKIGGGNAIILNDPQAKVGYAEFSGAGLASLDKGLEQKEHQMAILGASLFNGVKGGVEASETARIRTSGENSLLSGIASATEEVLENCLNIMAKWMGINYEIDLHINRDFIGERITAQEITALVSAFTAGTITLEMFLQNLQTGEILPDDMDVEEKAAELKGIAEEKAASAQAAQIDTATALAQVKTAQAPEKKEKPFNKQKGAKPNA